MNRYWLCNPPLLEVRMHLSILGGVQNSSFSPHKIWALGSSLKCFSKTNNFKLKAERQRDLIFISCVRLHRVTPDGCLEDCLDNTCDRLTDLHTREILLLM